MALYFHKISKLLKILENNEFLKETQNFADEYLSKYGNELFKKEEAQFCERYGKYS